MPRRRALTLLATLGLLLALAVPAGATTVAYWRMEADLDATTHGLRVANEVAGGSDLLSAEAFVDLAANPGGTVPQTGSINLGSVGASQQGGPNGINAVAAAYSVLDVTDITLEFWARTGEGTATLFQRSTGANGLFIDTPNALRLRYYVSNGAGGATAVTLNNLTNMDAGWHHYAFSYESATGIGIFYVDGVAVRTNDGPDNRALVWNSAAPVRIGVQMDYASAFNGTLDEVRISNLALAPTQFLSAVPEPGTALLMAAGLAGLALGGTPRRRAIGP